MVMDKYSVEIQNLMSQFGARAANLNEKQLLQLQREENAALMELLKQHKRELDWLAGEKVEPVTHQGEAVLIGIGAGIG